ncbi:MAG: ATP-binding protein [Desulfuromonadales bacterium]
MTIGIKRILFLTTFLSAGLPMLLVGVISLHMFKLHLRNEMERESAIFSHSVAEQIRTYLHQPVRTLSLARDHIESQQHNGSGMEIFFHDVLRTYDYFDSIYLLDHFGTVRQAGNRSNPIGTPDLHGMDLSSQQSFQLAVREKRASWSSSQTLSGGEPTLALCIPARDGAIMANLRLAELSRIINEASSSHNYTAFIVEKGGRIIAHPDTSLVERRENVGGLPLLQSDSENTRSGNFNFQTIRYHATVVPISETQWKLVVAKRLEIADKPIHYIENTFLYCFGVMLLLASCGAVVGNRIISKPFSRMEEQSRLVAEGRFDEVVSVESRCSEIAMLSETISAMAAEVHQRELVLHDQNDELLATEEMLRTQINEYHETHDQLMATEEMLRVQLEVSESNQLLLSESNRKLETLIDSSPLAIINLDHDGRISLWNQAANVLFGCSAATIGYSLKRLFSFERGYEEFFNRLETEPYLRLPELLLNSFDDRMLVVSLVSAPLSTASHTSEYLLMLEDITKRAQLEEQLRHAQKMDVIGQLAGGIAHDFNNMLAGIMASADLMKHRMPEDDINLKMVSNILNAASRSADLTRDLLTFSRKGVKENCPVAVNDTIASVIGLLERTIDKSIHLETRLEAVNPIVLGDPALLQNALLNLGINARDAMPEGGTLTYATSLVTLDAADCQSIQILLTPGAYLQISVSDTGTGIPREIMSRIFEPFFTTKEQGKGTGLGLAAVYGTVRDHKGSINVFSETGHGTIFNVFLPLCTVKSATVEQGNGIVRGSGGILLIDDEEILRSVGGDLLGELGYTAYLAEDGLKGIELYARHRSSIVLVILDMLMPAMSGLDTFKLLQEIDPDVQVIFCSGFHNEGTDRQLKELGAKGFIQKPYSIGTLGRTLSEVIAS